MHYVAAPKANQLVREIFQIVTHNSVMDKNVSELPRAQALYSENFEDKPDYVQDIIRTRQREKYKKILKKTRGDSKRFFANFDSKSYLPPFPQYSYKERC